MVDRVTSHSNHPGVEPESDAPSKRAGEISAPKGAAKKPAAPEPGEATSTPGSSKLSKLFAPRIVVSPVPLSVSGGPRPEPASDRDKIARGLGLEPQRPSSTAERVELGPRIPRVKEGPPPLCQYDPPAAPPPPPAPLKDSDKICREQKPSRLPGSATAAAREQQAILRMEKQPTIGAMSAENREYLEKSRRRLAPPPVDTLTAYDTRVETIKRSGPIAPLVALGYVIAREASGESLDAEDYRRLTGIYQAGEAVGGIVEASGNARRRPRMPADQRVSLPDPSRSRL